MRILVLHAEVVRGHLDFLREDRLSEIIVAALPDKAVVAGNRFLQHLRINIHDACHFVDIRGLPHLPCHQLMSHRGAFD